MGLSRGLYEWFRRGVKWMLPYCLPTTTCTWVVMVTLGQVCAHPRAKSHWPQNITIETWQRSQGERNNCLIKGHSRDMYIGDLQSLIVRQVLVYPYDVHIHTYTPFIDNTLKDLFLLWSPSISSAKCLEIAQHLMLICLNMSDF